MQIKCKHKINHQRPIHPFRPKPQAKLFDEEMAVLHTTLHRKFAGRMFMWQATCLCKWTSRATTGYVFFLVEGAIYMLAWRETKRISAVLGFPYADRNPLRALNVQESAGLGRSWTWMTTTSQLNADLFPAGLFGHTYSLYKWLRMKVWDLTERAGVAWQSVYLGRWRTRRWLFLKLSIEHHVNIARGIGR